MYDDKQNFMKYIVCVLILCTIIFFASSMTAKAHDVNDTTITEHSITWYIDYESGTSYGLYKGTFVESLNIPNGAVIYYDDYYAYIYYALLKEDGSVISGKIDHKSTSEYGKSWLSSYSSSTYKTSDAHSWYYYSTYVRSRSKGEIASCTLPVFANKAAASEYLLNGVMNSDTCLNYNDFINIPSPYDISVNSDNEDKYKIYINFKQYIEELNGFHLNYRLEHQIKTDEIEENNYDTKSFNNYEILSEHQIIENINSLISGLVFDDNDDMCTIRFQLYNSSVANESIKSNIATVELRIDINGIFERIYGYDGCKDNLSSLLWLPLKSQSGHTDSVLGGNSNAGIPYDSSFVGSVVNGFGLLGNNGLFALLSQLFSFVPNQLWTMFFAFLGGAMLVALFKYIVK